MFNNKISRTKFLGVVTSLVLSSIFASQSRADNAFWTFYSQDTIYTPTLDQDLGWRSNGGQWCPSGQSPLPSETIGFAAYSGGFLRENGQIRTEGQASGASLRKLVSQEYRFDVPQLLKRVRIPDFGIRIKGAGHIDGGAAISSRHFYAGAGSNIAVCGQYYLGNGADVGQKNGDGSLSSDYNDSKNEWVNGSTQNVFFIPNPDITPDYDNPDFSLAPTNYWRGFVSWAEYAGCEGSRCFDLTHESTDWYRSIAQVRYANPTVSIVNDFGLGDGGGIGIM
jgi:hypothetical protein